MLLKTAAVWPPLLLGSKFSCTQSIPNVAEFSDSCQWTLHQHSLTWFSAGSDEQKVRVWPLFLLINVAVVGGMRGDRQETTPPLVETLYWLSIYNVIYPGFLIHPLSLLLKTSLWVKTFITRFLMWHHCASHFSGVCVLLNFTLFWLICSRMFEFRFRLSVIFYNSLPNYYFSGTCKNCFFFFLKWTIFSFCNIWNFSSEYVLYVSMWAEKLISALGNEVMMYAKI